MTKTPADKLGIKAGHRLLVENPPESGLAILEPLPDGVTVQKSPHSSGADVVILFAADTTELHRRAPAILTAASNGALVWIAYRKGGASDLSRDSLMSAFVDLGWHGVSLVALDAQWTAARFRELDQIGH